jgi:hypothetical protein
MPTICTAWPGSTAVSLTAFQYSPSKKTFPPAGRQQGARNDVRKGQPECRVRAIEQHERTQKKGDDASHAQDAM